jgi:tripartite ATP-independent transporter DctM subunit
MEWYWALLLMFGLLGIMMLTGIPIFIAFIGTCVVGAVVFWGGLRGIDQLMMSFYSSITWFTFLPIPLFILMGEIIFQSGVGSELINAVDKFIGRVPGRLSLIAIGAGVLIGTMSGVSGSAIAILGLTLLPEMTKRGYDKSMTLGPIVGCGTLDNLIPPSTLAILLGSIGKISIGPLLIAIIVPGLILAVLYILYVIIRCVIKPSLAPSYDTKRSTLMEKLYGLVRHILPTGLVIFAVIGVVFLGICTPSEAAALGVVACLILAAINKRLNWSMLKTSAINSIQVTVMVLMIVVASISFSRILAMSGVVTGLASFCMSLPVPSIFIVIASLIVVLIFGCFIDPASIIMISAPIFIPVVILLGYNILWYGVMLLIALQLGLITPPFGLDVYTMKAIAPPDVKIGDVFRSSMPFLFIGLFLIVIIGFFPQVALWLPSVMK